MSSDESRDEGFPPRLPTLHPRSFRVSSFGFRNENRVAQQQRFLGWHHVDRDRRRVDLHRPQLPVRQHDADGARLLPEHAWRRSSSCSASTSSPTDCARARRSRFTARLRALIVLSLSLVAFGVLMTYAGFIPALAALIFGSASAGREFKFVEVLLLTVILTGLSVAVFIWGLGLPYPLIKGF